MQPQWLFNGFVRVHRAFAPFRIVQAYGVFPPHAAPPQRWVVQFEASWDDGASWHAFALPYLNYAMAWVAPYHPRVDHSLFYESTGGRHHVAAAVVGLAVGTVAARPARATAARSCTTASAVRSDADASG